MDMFSALAEPTRRNILELLVNSGRMSASEIYAKFNTSPQAISQHLKVLRDTELVLVEKKAQQRIYTVNQEAMSEFERWAKKMAKLQSERFDKLDMVLQEEKIKLKNK